MRLLIFLYVHLPFLFFSSVTMCQICCSFLCVCVVVFFLICNISLYNVNTGLLFILLVANSSQLLAWLLLSLVYIFINKDLNIIMGQFYQSFLLQLVLLCLKNSFPNWRSKICSPCFLLQVFTFCFSRLSPKSLWNWSLGMASPWLLAQWIIPTFVRALLSFNSIFLALTGLMLALSLQIVIFFPFGILCNFFLIARHDVPGDRNCCK